jgi:hypothetical protein
MVLTDIWHFHRPLLAKRYLDTLNAGLITSTTIFAPRRVGKTSFLLRDLSPAALAFGYCVAYADLWQIRTSPGQAIVYGLERGLEAARRRGRVRRVVSALTPSIKKISAKAQLGVGQLEGEVELAARAKDATETALRIDALIDELTRIAPVLLLVDEAQELARSKENELVATGLRAAMMTHQSRLRVVFTGSSRSQLASVFAHPSAPLFSTGAAIGEFPKLDRDFISYIAERFRNATKRSLDQQQAWDAFISFDQQPEPFLIGIATMALDPSLTLTAAVQAVRAKALDSDNYQQSWHGLNALQRALVRMLADDAMLKPFSQEVVSKLRTLVGVEHLAVTHVQRAMRGIASIVNRSGSDRFEFEDPAFAEWVRLLEE